ncbi:AlwI family type II restriction endonuclease [Proteiniborus sp. MB09-C3]|uniref:AlwI family type II restriction endonuclease n=1 Tax=Proteiniborus sp. MB09-C3 TaxID=3050072 RepID=UPI002553F42E|nr:AlwI family type II restriction endonuclease [Proteiniborus sp. MB09-C3]WIV12452.1 AlwI family type II restriction endonuclease [Proteiniborus sp. MB09-C3]
MRKIWNVSTTLRNPNRILGFLEVISQLEGQYWDEATQNEYQILLIKEKKYRPDIVHPALKNEQISYEEAKDIYDKARYIGKSMRGRVSFNPLKKLGFVKLESDKIKISKSGKKLISGEYSLKDALTIGLSKWKITANGANIKPYIGTLHFLNRLEEKTGSSNGITEHEFGCFVMTLKRYDEIDNFVNDLVNYRNNKFNLNSLLKKYENANSLDDYIDNNRRYFEETNYISFYGWRLRLNNHYMEEIKKLLSKDDARAF